MINSKKTLIAAVVAGALAFGATRTMADTITVSNGAAPSLVTSGPHTGDEQFNYSISFSPTTAINAGDGFLIADFGGFAGATLSAGTGNAPSSSIFTLSTPLGGGVIPTGLNDEVNPSIIAGDDEFLNGSAPEFIVDNATVGDIVYTAGSSFTGNGTTPGTLVLTVYSTETFVDASGFSIGIDQSGSSGQFAADPNTVDVPTPAAPPVAGTPLPASSIGGGLLIALLAAYKARKARLMA